MKINLTIKIEATILIKMVVFRLPQNKASSNIFNQTLF